MKIVMDLRSIRNLESGDGQFSSQIINQCASLDNSNEYILLVRPENKELFKIDGPNFALRVENINPYSFKERFVLGKIIKNINPDIYHTFTFSAPLAVDCKVILSIYDITHLVFPHLFSLRLNLYYKFIVSKCVKRANAILTISQHSKSDIANRFQVEPGKIKSIYCGVNSLYKPIDKEKARKYIKDKFSVSGKFILYVGQVKKHKNIRTTLYSFQKIRQNGYSDIKLVICGRGCNKVDWLLKLIGALGLKERVKLIDTPSNIDLLHFYNSAELFIYLSLYEGFGLPPLEAMACGMPVVSSNVSSLPEVLGDAALLTDPLDINAISDAIMKVLLEQCLKENLIKNGIARASSFRWEGSARSLLELYREIADSK